MEKGFILVDKPKNCYECELSHRLNPDELINCQGQICSDTSSIFGKIPDYCKIKTLPEYKNPDVQSVEFIFNNGWNACLNKIKEDT